MKKATPENNLAKKHPNLSLLWHPTKNCANKPENYLPKSNKVVWWQCNQGHEWKARIEHLSRSIGCPYCSGHRASPENNLEKKYPEIAKCWHKTKNKTCLPSQVTPRSDKKVWWFCSTCGHEWEARIANITRPRGNGCPSCQRIATAENNRKLGISRSGSLLHSFPEIAKEWHPTKNKNLTAQDVSTHSGRRVWWRCKKGHEWQVQVNSRTRGEGTWCPICSPNVSKLEVAIYCELKSIFGNVEWQKKINKRECDIFIKSLGLAIELDGYPWHEGKEKRDLLKNEVFLQEGYKTVRIRDKRLKKLSDIDVLYDGRNRPHSIVKQLLKTLENNNLNKRCYNDAVKRYLKSRLLQNKEEYTHILSTLPGPPFELSIEHLYPHLVKEWHNKKNFPLAPSLFTKGSNQLVWWRCKKDHEWQASIVDRTSGRGCPACAQVSKGIIYKKIAVNKKGSLFERNPKLSAEWHPSKNGLLRPTDRSSGSQEKVWWLCQKSHEWQATIVSRSRGNGCPFCSGRLPTKENCLKTKNPTVSKEWNFERNGTINPQNTLPNSNKRVWWKCVNGHEWQARVNDRNKGTKCPICTKNNRRKKSK